MKVKFSLILLAAVFRVSFAIGETVTSDNFELIGANGKITAQLTSSGEGTPGLFIYDENHIPRVVIGLYADGAPAVVINDNQGRAGAIMRLVNNNGNPVVVLKQDGQDKVIIDQNGFLKQHSSPPSTSNWLICIFSLLGGFLGGYLVLWINRTIKPSS